MATIRLLILDVDGVLTDGKIYLTADGDENKCFHTQDGFGLVELQRAGIPIAIISGRHSTAVKNRMSELGITQVHLGVQNKLAVFEQLLDDYSIDASQVAYVGDDVPDLTVMQLVGHKIAVANATPKILAIADWVTKRNGGNGAVREVTDWILQHHA